MIVKSVDTDMGISSDMEEGVKHGNLPISRHKDITIYIFLKRIFLYIDS